MSRKPRYRDIDCYQVQRELSDYLEGDVTPQFRVRLAEHLQSSDHCNPVYDALRNIVRLLGNEDARTAAGFELGDVPASYVQRAVIGSQLLSKNP